MSTRTFSPDAQLNGFCEWVVLHGGFVRESLILTAPDSEFGSQVRTTADIPPDALLLSCPHALAIDFSKARAHFPAAFVAATPPHAVLCLFLASQRLLGEASFWWPYLRILPREFDTPLYFDPDDLRWLQGCNLDAREAAQRKVVWKQELDVAVAALRRDGVDTAGYTWPLFLWAATVFSSRSFSGKLMAWTDDLTAAAMGEPDSLPALFPLMDAVNHQPLTKITWQPGDRVLSAVSGAAISAGAEVCNNYGPKSNEELLMGYGFTLPSNPFDTVVLRIKPALSPAQAALHASLSSSPADALHHLTPRTSASPSTLPAALITLFNILTATPTELSLRPAQTTLRNTLAAHSQLLAALRQKLCCFPREPLLPPCTNARRRAARTYRDAQLAILVAAISETELVLRTLCCHPAATTLRSVLATAGPFRDAVEVCFGTADERVLGAGDHADLVVTLYLCWRYILHLRSNSSSSASSGVWGRWLEAYGPTTETETEPGAEQFVREVWEDVIPAGARAAPAVFAGPEWTPEMLSWGMRVFGGEGVSVNVCLDGGDKEGKGEEEEEEDDDDDGEEEEELFVVFLE